MFTRRDQNAVDWTYDEARPFARQANSVDLDVDGLEFTWQQQWGVISGTVGATFIHKKSEYGSAQVDASYYALNYAKERFTAALEWRLSFDWILRWDNEYREQAEKPFEELFEHGLSIIVLHCLDAGFITVVPLNRR